jgi:CheY-like chemotaxis protein/anti-sigma regulatory factor (Ser/Thr protein kinase)
LGALVSTSRSAVAAQAAEKSILVTVSISPALPATATGDPSRLKQVLINLLGNAVKFTDSGRVVLTAEPGPEGFMRIEVTDTGPGVPDALKVSIFERFTQADSSSTRRKGGAGLGLAICSDLVRLAGGRIGVEDAPDGGARFWFDWPLGSDAEIKPDMAAPRPAHSAGTVLVAEDNMVNALLLQEALAQAGYGVLHARDGREAVDIALSKHPDVILIDVHMPELNGLQAIEAIRERAPAPAPFIVLTADVTDETRRKVSEIGPHHAFNKPVDIGAVLQAVSDAIAPPPEKVSA